MLESLLGAWIVKREGGKTWAALQDALRSGRMPSRQLSDAALVLIGGTLLLTPGFVTDIVGFFFILPLTRPITRVWLETVVARRLLGPMGEWPATRHGTGGRPRTRRSGIRTCAARAGRTSSPARSSRARSSTPTVPDPARRPTTPGHDGCRAPARGTRHPAGSVRRTCACGGARRGTRAGG